jgi:hypothetical protein
MDFVGEGRTQAMFFEHHPSPPSGAVGDPITGDLSRHQFTHRRLLGIAFFNRTGKICRMAC